MSLGDFINIRRNPLKRDSKKNFIAVVIRQWNASNYVIKLLNDLRAAHSNSPLPYQIYIIDDASRDKSDEKILKLFPESILLKSDTRIEYAASLNWAAKEAVNDGAKFIFFCNADCYSFSGNFLNNLVEDMLTNNFKWISPTIYDAEGNNLSSLRQSYRFNVPFNVQTESHLFESKIFMSLGGFDENLIRYGEDIELANRYLNKGFKMGTSSSASLVHVGSGLSSKQIFVRTYFPIRNAFFLQKKFESTNSHEKYKWIRGTLSPKHIREARPLLLAIPLWVMGVVLGLVSGVIGRKNYASNISTEYTGSKPFRNFLLSLDKYLEIYNMKKSSGPEL